MLEKIIRLIIAFVLALLGIEYNPRPDEGPKDSAVIVKILPVSSASATAHDAIRGNCHQQIRETQEMPADHA